MSPPQIYCGDAHDSSLPSKKGEITAKRSEKRGHANRRPWFPADDNDKTAVEDGTRDRAEAFPE